jgi:hypothetical protein
MGCFKMTITQTVMMVRDRRRSCHYYVTPTTTTWHNSHHLPLHNAAHCCQSANFSNGPRICLIFSLRLVLLVLPVWPTYTLPHSQGIEYIPGTFRPKLSMADLSVWIFFLAKLCMFLILCLASNLLIFFVMECWYVNMVTPIGSTSYREKWLMLQI